MLALVLVSSTTTLASSPGSSQFFNATRRKSSIEKLGGGNEATITWFAWPGERMRAVERSVCSFVPPEMEWLAHVQEIEGKYKNVSGEKIHREFAATSHLTHLVEVLVRSRTVIATSIKTWLDQLTSSTATAATLTIQEDNVYTNDGKLETL